MRKKIKDLKEIKKVNIYSKKYTHIVMGSGSNDPEKYSPEASRETLDHSAMYIFAVALEDGFWHHETSYSNERKTRAETVRLWRKIETFEDPEFNKKYYDEKDPLKKVQGAKVEITLNDGSIIVETLDFANAHPGGTTPFRRNEYINKMKPLINGFVSQGEELRFVELINNLENLNSDEIKTLNLVCDVGTVDLNKNKINGIFN
tara:strand:- start:672 stop:1283 length:612 start_codon:yes stop_codon:yes gene_type:complete